ncbi:MAG: hypothetical protein R6V50_04435 [Thermoplasmatota archaeon]
MKIANIVKKKNRLFLLSVLVIVIIILSGFLIFVYTSIEEPEKIHTIETKTLLTPLLTKSYAQLQREGLLETVNIVDDRISPLVSQGIIVQINRIRHRGLLDELVKFGLSWRSKPVFYIELIIDGDEYNSKNLYGHHNPNYEHLFNTWDTLFESQNRFQKDISEEQETSDITIKIVERVSVGLLGLRSQDITREEIELTYCYRTGRWTGDNYFGHRDGYGRYRGDTFEVQFEIYQTNFAQDGIPYWTKVNMLELDPYIDYSYIDIDNDGIPVSWEWKWGYDPFIWDDHHNLDPSIDGITNYQKFLIEKYYADPFSQDIYIEGDQTERKNIFFKDSILYQESAQVVIERFAQNGINVYIDNGWPGTPLHAGGEMLPYIEILDQDSGAMLHYYKNHFPDERKGIFRYLIVTNLAGFAIPSTFNNYDTLTVFSNPRKMVMTAYSFTPRTHRIVQAAAILHELGHTVGITPWTIEGCDNFTYLQGRQQKQDYYSTWGDYQSVMNYIYIYDKKLLDYSDGSNGPPYDQNDWEHFYLPFFKIESNVIEDPFLELPGTDRMVDLDVQPATESRYGWEYHENLTRDYLSFWKSHCHAVNVRCDFRVYVSTDPTALDHSDQKNVRIYAKPDVEPTYALWSLIAEATLDDNDTLICNGQVLSLS